MLKIIAKTLYLKIVEILPAKTQGHSPNYKGTDGVQYHPGGCRHFFGDADTSKVKERNANNSTCLIYIELFFLITLNEINQRTKECTNQPWVVTELDKAIERVFKDTSGISAEGRANFDVVERN